MNLYRFDTSEHTRWMRPGFARNPDTLRVEGIRW